MKIDKRDERAAAWVKVVEDTKRPIAPRRLQLGIKRAVDITGGVALLIAVAPIILLAALLIRLGSPGPAFYSGLRWGFQGRKFACVKLRSMYIDQAKILARNGLTNQGDRGRLLVFDRDPRITRIGGLLRKWSIDELPQLINVVRGDMSLIGPRPLAISMLEDYPKLCAARSVMRPGITGLWQVRRRMKNASVFDMIDDDTEYVVRFSLMLDLKIAWQTLFKIIEPSVSERFIVESPSSLKK